MSHSYFAVFRHIYSRAESSITSIHKSHTCLSVPHPKQIPSRRSLYRYWSCRNRLTISTYSHTHCLQSVRRPRTADSRYNSRVANWKLFINGFCLHLLFEWHHLGLFVMNIYFGVYCLVLQNQQGKLVILKTRYMLENKPFCEIHFIRI